MTGAAPAWTAAAATVLSVTSETTIVLMNTIPTSIRCATLRARSSSVLNTDAPRPNCESFRHPDRYFLAGHANHRGHPTEGKAVIPGTPLITSRHTISNYVYWMLFFSLPTITSPATSEAGPPA
jgi:hypothetical protein